MAKHPFEQFNLESSLIDAVKDLNFEKPTEIQNRIIPRILKRTNLIGQSQTGTGKSHAFLLPLMQLIDSEIKRTTSNRGCTNKRTCTTTIRCSEPFKPI